jgi:hypothetical protein
MAQIQAGMDEGAVMKIEIDTDIVIYAIIAICLCMGITYLYLYKVAELFHNGVMP